MVFRGKVWKFGDQVSTDVMAPGFTFGMRWEERKQHVLHIHPEFSSNVKPGDLIVAGRNWGCGSSREQAPFNVRRLGIACIVAESFARIFFRNAISTGLPCIICPDVSAAFEEGDELEVNVETAFVTNITRNTRHQGEPLIPKMLHVLSSGGLVPVLREKMRENVIRQEGT